MRYILSTVTPPDNARSIPSAFLDNRATAHLILNMYNSNLCCIFMSQYHPEPFLYLRLVVPS